MFQAMLTVVGRVLKYGYPKMDGFLWIILVNSIKMDGLVVPPMTYETSKSAKACYPNFSGKPRPMHLDKGKPCHGKSLVAVSAVEIQFSDTWVCLCTPKPNG